MTKNRPISKWPVTTSFACLGHVLQNDGSIRACANAAKRGCWAAFWANFSSKRARKLPLQEKISVMNRAVTPIYKYKCSRWPAQRCIAKEFDKVQNKMLAILMNVPRFPGEQPHEYVRRRNHMASCQARAGQRWSAIWYARVVAWNDHLKRPANARSWAAQTLEFRGRAYLQERRIANHSESSSHGRTCTRSTRGVVHTRWHDGVDFARHQLKPRM